MNKTILLSIHALLLILCSTLIAQQNNNERVGIPWQGENGITVSVSSLTAWEKAHPSVFAIRPKKEEFEVERDNLKENPLAPRVASWPPLGEEELRMRSTTLVAPQTIGVSFLGLQISETAGYIPPDVMGDVSPTQVLVHVNGAIKVFDKNGNVGSLNVSDNTFWQSVRNGEDVSDPHVRYDRLSGRWFLCIINLPATGANRILIAVSSGSTITSTSSFTFFQFQQDLPGAPNADAGMFADYPTLGVDKNALYIGINMFDPESGDFTGTTAYVIRKSSLLGGTLVVTPFRQLTDGTTPGPYTPQGVQCDDTTVTDGYFIGVDVLEYSKLTLLRVSNAGGTPSISGNIELTVPATSSPIQQTVKGSASNRKLDAIDDRLFAAQIKKNRITGLLSLWTAHTVEVNSGGVGTAGGGRNGSRWYEITNFSSTPTLRQSGTVFSSASSNPVGYWMSSIAMSGQGHSAFGASYAGANDYASIAVTGRLSGDALGTTQSITNAVVSSTAYNVEDTGPQRWGDYSQTIVDPSDDMTMWTFQEYCNSTDSWALRAIQLLAPPPATPASASPASISTGSTNVTVVVTGTSVSGSGFFDPGAGFPNRISATVNGGGVTVNSASFTSPTSITLNLTVAGGAVAGARTITVINPDGQSKTSASGIVTITNSGCPVISLSPSSLPGGMLYSFYTQSVTASGGTAPYTYALTGGSLPEGITLSSGGVLSGIPTESGDFSITITTTDSALCAGALGYSFSITGCPAITLTPSTLPAGDEDVSYNQSITASGGAGPYTYIVSNGSLPSGLTLSSAGELSGTPSESGSFQFTVTATDTANCIGTLQYTLQIDASIGNVISLTTPGVAYTQDFNTLASSGSSSVLPAGWSFSESGSNANTTYTAGTGSANSGDTYSFGAASNSERALGGLQSGNLNPSFGAAFMNNTGGVITSVVISYTGEQWRLGATGRTDKIDFQLSTDASSITTGTWINYDDLDFAAPLSSGTVGPLDGNAPANQTDHSYSITGLNIEMGGLFFIRWTDLNVTGADDGLAVDGFSITPISCPVITITPESLPFGVIGNVYAQSLAAGGGTPPYAYSIESGNLPDSLSLSSGGEIQGTLHSTGIFAFTILVTDSLGCVATNAYTITVLDTTVTETLSVQSQWNLVSNPLVAMNDSVHAIFPGATSNAFAFTGAGGYQVSATLENGSGYWLKFSSAQDVQVNGAPIVEDTIDAAAGWNIIGSISQPVAASLIASIPPGIQTGLFYGYNSGYAVADTIIPGKGYWVKVTQDGKLILSASTSLLAANRIHIIPDKEAPPPPPSGEIEQERPPLPETFSLEQNYPNPFNPSTNFGFRVADFGMVILRIYDVLGREVATVVNKELNPGIYNLQWDAAGLPGGVYYYRLTAGTFSDMKKLLLMK